MSEVIYRIPLGTPAILEFRGPDAVRYLNGQLTQDVRKVLGGNGVFSSCVTDAKGRLQFRVALTEWEDAVLWVDGHEEWAEALEGRLTRYLIADDVDVSNRTGAYALVHFTGSVMEAPAGVTCRRSSRFGVDGTDWWIPTARQVEFPRESVLLEGDALEDYRVSRGLPAWGRELVEGMLPPEARLEATDISYQKGCYIGQEVISRIKSAGKVNRMLTRFRFDPDAPVSPGSLVNAQGGVAGEVTSVAPGLDGGFRNALGYLKRGAGEVFYRAPDGGMLRVESRE
jgi:folate-binding protein YgfZ